MPTEPAPSRRGVLAGLAVALAAPRLARAQDAGRPVRIIAPIAPGGLTDALARLLAQRLSERTGQAFVVENRAGGSGIIGMEAAARAAPDGSTLVLVYQGVASVNPVLHRNLSYDTLRDFSGVGLIGNFPILLTVPTSLPVRNAAEFIDLAKRRPGGLDYGSAGNATTSHLAMELFKRQAGIELTHVPFRGEAPALTELAAGRVSAVFATVAAAKPLIDAGQVRAIGVANLQPTGLAAGVPAIAMSGLAGFEVSGWYGLLAPHGTPAATIARYNAAMNTVLQEPEMRSRLAAMGLEPTGSTPARAEAWIAEDMRKWREVVTAAGIRVD